MRDFKARLELDIVIPFTDRHISFSARIPESSSEIRLVKCTDSTL